jgi:hypothetical protein
MVLDGKAKTEMDGKNSMSDWLETQTMTHSEDSEDSEATFVPCHEDLFQTNDLRRRPLGH